MNKIVITILSVALGFISCKDDSTGEILIKIRTSIPEYLQ